MSLHEVNPSIKAFAIVISILILSVFFDPITPLIIIFLSVTVTFLFGRVSFKKWLLLFAPFLFIACIYVWSTMLFPRLQEGDQVIWQWGFLTMTAEGFQRGASLESESVKLCYVIDYVYVNDKANRLSTKFNAAM